jgi:hypothetical protein
MSAQPQRQAPPEWRHTDSDPRAALTAALEVRGVQSFLTKPDGSAVTTSDRVRLVRSLGIATIYTIEGARTKGVSPPGEMETLRLGSEPFRAQDFPTPDAAYAASTLGRTAILFADPGRHVVYSAKTHDGDPAELTEATSASFGETAFPPLVLGAVIVLGIGVVALAICFNGQKIAEVIDRKLTQDALTARMMAAQSAAVALVDKHNERDRAAPYSPEEHQVLDALLDTQKQIVAQTNSPLPDPFGGAMKKMGDLGDKLAGGALSLGVIAALAGGLYLVTR